MTPERLEEIAASLVGQTDRDKACELAAEVRRLREDAEEREAWLRAYGSR